MSYKLMQQERPSEFESGHAMALWRIVKPNLSLACDLTLTFWPSTCILKPWLLVKYGLMLISQMLRRWRCMDKSWPSNGAVPCLISSQLLTRLRHAEQSHYRLRCRRDTARRLVVSWNLVSCQKTWQEIAFKRFAIGGWSWSLKVTWQTDWV